MEDKEKKVKITRENIDELYKKVNELIDNYFTWKIKPSSLKNYLKNGSIGLHKFIKFNELDIYENIEKIVSDIVDDRYSLELDGIKKFEKFEFADDEKSDIDSILYKNLDNTGFRYEKILADYFKVSLSNIKEEDLEKHIYTIDSLNDVHLVFILSAEDLEKIKKNLIEYTFDYINRTNLKMESLFLKFSLKDKVEEKLFKEKLSEEVKDMNIQDWITDVLDVDRGFVFLSEYKNYFIWEK